MPNSKHWFVVSPIKKTHTIDEGSYFSDETRAANLAVLLNGTLAAVEDATSDGEWEVASHQTLPIGGTLCSIFLLRRRNT